MALTSPTSKRRDGDSGSPITVKAVTPLWLHATAAEKCACPPPPLPCLIGAWRALTPYYPIMLSQPAAHSCPPACPPPHAPRVSHA